MLLGGMFWVFTWLPSLGLRQELEDWVVPAECSEALPAEAIGIAKDTTKGEQRLIELTDDGRVLLTTDELEETVLILLTSGGQIIFTKDGEAELEQDDGVVVTQDRTLVLTRDGFEDLVQEMRDSDLASQLITRTKDGIYEPRNWECVRGAQVVPLSEAVLTRAHEQYRFTCAKCHGHLADGNGPQVQLLVPRPRNFSHPEVQNQTDGAIFYKIWAGRDDMPQYGLRATEEEVWELVWYVRAAPHMPGFYDESDPDDIVLNPGVVPTVRAGTSTTPIPLIAPDR